MREGILNDPNIDGILIELRIKSISVNVTLISNILLDIILDGDNSYFRFTFAKLSLRKRSKNIALKFRNDSKHHFYYQNIY